MLATVLFQLLHTSPRAFASSSLDGRAIALALAALAFAAAFIWWSPQSDRATLLRVRTWSRLGRRIVGVMTALALLPAVLPYDHVLPGAHIDNAASEAVHASHCHVSPGTCSDVPLASGLGEFLFNEPLVLTPAMLAVVLLSSTIVLQGFAPLPELRPPELISAA
jgi:hypothetical protein